MPPRRRLDAENAEAMTLPRGGGATCKLDASDPKERTYFDGYAAMRRGGMRRGGGDVKTDEKSSATNRAF